MSGTPFTTIDHAASLIGQGHVVAIPTETVYGLAASAHNPTAIARVFAAKQRPANNPLIVHVASIDMARTVTSHWPDHAQRTAQSLWPGPITLVLPKADGLPDAVTARGPTVAVRMPDHPTTLALIQRTGPLVAPSANRSGTLSPTTAADARLAMNDPDLPVLDGGPCARGIESTVLALTTPTPHILRAGVIGAAQLATLLETPIAVDTDQQPEDTTPQSPGRLAKHYAPATPTHLFTRADLDQMRARHTGPCAIVWIGAAGQTPADDTRFELPADPQACAATLYATLRRADEAGCTAILIERPPATGDLWDAIRDRLTRASAP